MKDLEKKVAMEMVGFEYFSICIKNGATVEQAKAEMLTEAALTDMAERVKAILEA